MVPSRHMKSHSEERPHKCILCERGFKTLASLRNHVNNTHTRTKPYRCTDCQSAFITPSKLVRHVKYKHTHEKPHKCTICDYACVELDKMRIHHMRCHTDERPYQCPHCTYASPDNPSLKRHLRIHTREKPYECDICKLCFAQSNTLKRHKLTHTAIGDKPVYQCELCPATCGRKTDLRKHVQKLHTSDKLLTCKRCGKHFPDRYSYKVHRRSHEREKAWKCNLCPYASFSQLYLKSHMLTHTAEKPYQCEQCDQGFHQKQLLKRHQNLHNNPDYVPPTSREKTHECPECQREFIYRGNLIRHMTVHGPDAAAAEKTLAPKIGRQKKDREEDEQVAVVGSGSSQHISEEEKDEGKEILHDIKSSPRIDNVEKKNIDASALDTYQQDIDSCFGFDEYDKEREEDHPEVKTEIPSKDLKDIRPYAFVSQQHLKSHMLTHTAEKPYQCEQCDQAFRQKQLLKRHQNLYHNRDYVPPTSREKTHECPECQREFIYRGNLIRHMTVHGPDAAAAEKTLAPKIGRQKKDREEDEQVAVVGSGSSQHISEEEKDEGKEILHDIKSSPRIDNVEKKIIDASALDIYQQDIDSCFGFDEYYNESEEDHPEVETKKRAGIH